MGSLPRKLAAFVRQHVVAVVVISFILGAFLGKHFNLLNWPKLEGNDGKQMYVQSQDMITSGPALPVDIVQRKSSNVIRSPTLPETGAASGLIRLLNTRWFRFGKPWRSTNFRVARFVLYCVPGPRAQLVFYSQKLSGVFNRQDRQYIALWVNTEGHLVGRILLQGQRSTVTEFVGDICNGNPHAITLGVTSASELFFTASALTNFLPSTNPDLDSMGKYQYSEEHNFQHTKGIELDSGLYFGGVQDRKYITAAEDLPEFDNLNGVIYRQITVNEKALLLTSNVDVRSGIVNEYIGRYLLEERKMDLSKPLPSPPKMEDTDMADIGVQHFPVISLVSDNHFDEVVGMIATVHKVMPKRSVIVYDGGLSKKHKTMLGSFCRTIVRAYRSDLYGVLVGNLWEYRFKPLLIHSAIDEFGGAVYADSSIRFHRPVTDIPLLQHGYGFVTFGPASTSPIHAFTHDTMLKYFGVSRDDVTNATIAIGGINVWLDRQFAQEVVLWQWFRCVLDKNCIAPNGAKLSPCDFALGKIPGRYIGCHRFDQSALSVILLKTFHNRFGDGTILKDPEDLKYVVVEREKSEGLAPCKRS